MLCLELCSTSFRRSTRWLFDTSAAVAGVANVTALPEPLAIGASVTRYAPGSVAIRLAAPAPKGSALMVSENYYPGWQATVGRKTSRHRARRLYAYRCPITRRRNRRRPDVHEPGISEGEIDHADCADRCRTDSDRRRRCHGAEKDCLKKRSSSFRRTTSARTSRGSFPRSWRRIRRSRCLIVDDGSPDGTGAIADGIAAADSARPRHPPPGKARPRHGLRRRLQVGARARLRLSSSRWTPTSRIHPSASRSFFSAIQDADLVLGSRYLQRPSERRELADEPAVPQLFGANIYARGVTGLPIFDATGGFKCFRRAVLEAIDLDRRPVQWLRVSDRDELPRVEEGLSHRRDPDRLRRPDGRREQDVEEDRPGSGLDGLAPALVGRPRRKVDERCGQRRSTR